MGNSSPIPAGEEDEHPCGEKDQEKERLSSWLDLELNCNPPVWTKGQAGRRPPPREFRIERIVGQGRGPVGVGGFLFIACIEDRNAGFGTAKEVSRDSELSHRRITHPGGARYPPILFQKCLPGSVRLRCLGGIPHFPCEALDRTVPSFTIVSVLRSAQRGRRVQDENRTILGRQTDLSPSQLRTPYRYMTDCARRV